jgi:hypothetical protein
MSEEEIIPAKRFDEIPIKNKLEIGAIMDDIDKILHGEASISENDFQQRAEEMLDKLQRTSGWLYKLRQIERTRISELQGSMLNKMKAILKGESVKSQIDELDRKAKANQELTNLYGEIIVHLENLLQKSPKR